MNESQEVHEHRGRSIIIAWVIVPLVLLAGLLFFTLRNRAPSEKKIGSDELTVSQDNPLADVRRTLARQNDIATCRAIIAQLNQHLQSAKEHQLAPLTGAERERRRTECRLADDDLAEYASQTFTNLDAHHLDACFLHRDAARSLEAAIPAATGGKTVRQTPLDRAALAFAWVVRQVRLQEPGPEPAPPAAVLRRGSGSALERALIFLALLEQFGLEEDDSAGLQGCLLWCPDTGGTQRFWACGVAVGTKPDAIYLFDPRLGLPIPAADGKGIATLAQAQAGKGAFGHLTTDQLAYDVTAEQAKAAKASLAVPLSALTPRMRLLQDRLLRDREWQGPLPAQVRVRLAENPDATLSVLRAAMKVSGGKPEDVTVWQEGVTALRRFLPKGEGGKDDGALQLFFYRGAAPWEDFPEPFRDRQEFGTNAGLGLRLRGMFSEPFLRPLVDPNSPREMLLRGRFRRTVPELVKEQEQWQQVKSRRDTTPREELQKGVIAWIDAATTAYGEMLRGEPSGRERVDNLWKWKPNDPIALYLLGSAAEGRLAEVSFQLGLCMHEQAARQQARLDLLQRAGAAQAVDVDETRNAWESALNPWRDYTENHAGRSGSGLARRLRGEVLDRLGRSEEAIAVWRDVSGPMTDLEKLAALWLAKQAAARPKAN